MARKYRTMRCSLVVLAVFFILANGADALAAAFSATMVETKNGKTYSGPFFMLGDRYRMEVAEEGRQIVVLVDRKAGRTRLLVPDEGVYLEMANNDMQSLMNNAFEAHQHMVDNYEARSAGSEAVAGMTCDKQIIAVQGKDVMTVWVAKDYGFPIRLENQMNGSLMELKDIVNATPDAGLFEVPAGLKLVKAMPIAPPDWAGDIPSAPVMTPPVERTLDAGQIIRIKPVRNFDLDVTVKSLSGMNGAFSSNAFKEGRPLKRVTGYAGGGRKVHKESPDDADEIVVRAQSGKITVAVSLVEAPEGIILKKDALKANQGKQISIDHRKPARVTLRDNPDDGKRSRGTLILYTTIEKKMDGGTAYDKQEVHREPLLLSNGTSRSWSFETKQAIGSVDITMLEGGVAVRIEQPENADVTPPSWSTAPASEAAPIAATAAATTSATDARVTPAQPASATTGTEASARMVLVLDGSGSMWGQIDGKAKIAIAKSVMGELIDQIPADFQTGLMVYGHRRKGDCNDIEMLVPVGPHNPTAMKAKVQAISPKGKTPLSEAVRQAAQALRYTEERATVVLVSDGLETCDIDPCQLAAELAMSGVDFTVHVIGFDIGQEDQARLRCLADKTGGLFLAAGSAGALRDALFTTVEKVKEPPPPVVEDPGTATLRAPASVPAGSEFAVQWEGPDSRGDYIAIAEKGSKDNRHRDYTYTKMGNPAAFVAPGDVGGYELRYVHGHTRKVIGRTAIQVTPVQATVQAPASSDVAVEFEVRWQGPAYAGDYISIARPDHRPNGYVNYTYTREGNPLKLRAPSEPGTYEVRYILGRGSKLLAKTTISVEGVGASVDAPPVADVATEFEVSWTGPANKEDYVSIARLDHRPNGYVNYTYTREGSPLKLRAPSEPGTYEVRYILGRGSKLLAKTTIEIKAVTASVTAPASSDVAVEFEVSWEGPANKEDYVSIARPDHRPNGYVNYTYTREGSPLKLRAPSEPGTYEVRYILGRGSKLLAKTTIEIKAVTASVTAPASAKAGGSFEVRWEGPDNKGDYISIARPDQRPRSYKGYTYTSKGNPLEVKAPKEPGTYEVRYILGRGSKLLDKTTIEITP